MKKRILFVDNEPMALAALQRVLRPLRDEWEMEFVEDGPAALERMNQAPFDVVVADLVMRGMNGVELLTEVMRRHPHAVRLILSGHTDQQLIMRCVGITHQYLAKPCDIESLKRTIQRASSVDASLKSEKLRDFVGRMDKVPSIPALYLQLQAKLRDPEISPDEIGDLIARDIGMTAQMLKLVNSAYFGLSHQIIRPQEAVAYLGLNTINNLVLALGVFSQFEKNPSANLLAEGIWKHSLATAAIAPKLASLERAGTAAVEQSSVAAMLHDIGKLILAANFADEYGRLNKEAATHHVSPFALEDQFFGADHAAVGGYLLGLWGLPVPVVEAILMHHQPGLATQPQFSPLTAVHAANVLEHELNRVSPITQQPADPAYLNSMGMSDRWESWREAAISALDRSQGG